MTKPPFSVLISVYEKDNPIHVQKALQSVIEQTVEPEEIVIIGDGPFPNFLLSIIEEFKTTYPDIVRFIQLETNQGLGAALQTGVRECSHNLVARMDADDVAVKDRFEQQLEFLSANPDVDVVGGYIGEFEESPSDIKYIREVPDTGKNVKSYARFRCPTNHPTVMFRRDAVLDAGNYRPLRSQQDYELWMRMLTKGYTIENIPTVLVKCRGGSALFERRGGLSYARIEWSLQKDFLAQDAITRYEFIRNIVLRMPIRLLPSRIRGLIYRSLLRN